LEGNDIPPVYGIDKRKIQFTYLLHVGISHDYFNLIMLQIGNAKIWNGVEEGREIS
jgi:putative Mn2+ efflux pump MntP